MLPLVSTLAWAGPYATLSGTISMTAADEYTIGKSAASTRTWLEGRWVDATQQRRTEELVRGLVAASDRPDMIVTVLLVDSAEINASAYPGGFIVVNRGTLEKMDDPQLAFVLGHELAHAELRHGVNALNLATAARTASSLTAAQAAGDREVAQRQAQELRLLTSGFSRQQELEADVYGLLYAMRAGWSSDGAVQAMETLRTVAGGEIPVQYRAYADHPTYSDRIREIQLARQTVMDVASQFDRGVAALAAGRREPAVAAFESYLTLFPRSIAGWSNLAAAWSLDVPDPGPWKSVLPTYTWSDMRVRADATLARDRALDAIQHALRLDPSDPVALGVAGLLAMREGDALTAHQLLDEAVEISEGWTILVLDRGNAAMLLGDEKAAAADWAQALAEDPTLTEARVNQALALELKKGGRKKAIAAWEELYQEPRWARLAAERLNGLGRPVEAPPAPAAPAPDAFLSGEQAVVIGRDVTELEASLGAPDATQAAGTTRVSVWDGLSVLSHDERIDLISCEWTCKARTRSGVGIGMKLENLPAALGAADLSQDLGSRRFQAWNDTGLVVVSARDLVVQVVLRPPVAQ